MFFYADIPYALTKTFVQNRLKKFIIKKNIKINYIYKNSRTSPIDSDNYYIINLFKDLKNALPYCSKKNFKIELIETLAEKSNKLIVINCYKTQFSIFEPKDLNNFEIEYYFKIYD